MAEEPRLIRWIGDPSPWDDPVIQRAIAQERLPLAQIEWLRFYDVHLRDYAIPGRSEKTLGPAHGFGEIYRFGPQQFLAWLAPADAALLLGNEWDRWQFLDVTDDPSRATRPAMTANDWAVLQRSFDKLTVGRRLRPQYR